MMEVDTMVRHRLKEAGITGRLTWEATCADEGQVKGSIYSLSNTQIQRQLEDTTLYANEVHPYKGATRCYSCSANTIRKW